MFVTNKYGKSNMYVIRIQPSEPGWLSPLKDKDEVSSMS